MVRRRVLGRGLVKPRRLGAAALSLAVVFGFGACIRRTTPALTSGVDGPVPTPDVPIEPTELRCPPPTDTGLGQTEPLAATSQIARWPVLRRQPLPPPEVPAGEARGRVVELRLQIDDSGYVRGAEVTASARPDLDRAAVAVMKGSRFAPACTPGGLTTRATIPWRYRFP